MTIAITKNGKSFCFDSSDWALVAKYKWSVNKKGYVMSHPYNKEEKKTERPIYLHRLLMNLSGCYPLVDHINRNPSDNRRINLRIASYSQSCMNRKGGYGIHGFTGVTVKSHKRNGVICKSICAQIIVNHKKIHLGTFETPEQAALAYNEAAKKYFGEFAYQNIV